MTGKETVRERVAAYMRVSSDEQRERETIEIQDGFLGQYADLYKLDVVAEYRDEGISGTVPLHERPEGRRLLENAKAGNFDVLLVYRLDRMGRSLLVTVDAHDRLDACGVALRSATEPIDTSTPSGRLVFGMLASFSEYEREAIAERTRAGLHRAYRNGKHTGRVPYGYRVGADGLLEVVEEEAAVVREIVANIAAGSTLYAESKHLNDLGIPSPGWRFKDGARVPGKGWSPSTVRGIVHQGAYSGTHEVRIDGGETIRREVPAVLERGLQKRALTALRENKRYPDRENDRRYLLRGLVRCEVCGFACTGRTTTSTYKGVRKKYSYYGCISNRAERGKAAAPPHRAPNINAAWLEDLVWGDVRLFLKDPGETLERVRGQLAGGTGEDAAELTRRQKDLQRRLAARQAEKDRYVRLYAQGHISEEELGTYLLDLKNHTENLRMLIDAAETDLSHRRERAEIAATTHAWLLTLSERLSEVEQDTQEAYLKRRELVKLLVGRIDLGREEDGRVRARITYRFGPLPGAPEGEGPIVDGKPNSCGNLAAKRKPSGETSRHFRTVERRGVP